MKDEPIMQSPELEALFRKYESAPTSHVFAPLSDAYRKAGRLEEAIAICEKGVEHNPDYASGYVVQGKCYYDAGETINAERAFHKVLDLDENNLVALMFLGMIMAERGDASEARERFKHILALDPDNKKIKRRIAELSDDDEVIELRELEDEDFEGRSISLGDHLETSDELATLTLADIYASQGYTDKAIRIFNEVLKSDPDNETARRRLAELGGEAPPAPSREVSKPVEVKKPKRVGLEAPWDDPGEDELDELLGTTEEAPAEAPETVVNRAAPPQSGESKPAVAASEDPFESTPRGGEIGEARSYDYFKRWLKKMGD